MSSNAIETPPLAAQLESLSALIRRTEPFCQRISAVGMYIFMGLVILTFADVLLRYVIGSPISGSIEITEMLMSVVLFSSVAYTYWRRGHVSMDIVTAGSRLMYLSPISPLVLTEAITSSVRCTLSPSCNSTTARGCLSSSRGSP